MEPVLHVLSKNGLFLFRFNNGEFGSKWCGIWKADTKYFDYFAFRLDDEFLSEANFKKFSFYNSQFSTLEFETSKGNVIEEIKCYDDCVLISIIPSYKTTITSEIGINIRKRNENYAKGKRYNLENLKNGLKAEFNGKAAFIYFKEGEFTKEEYYGIHSPGRYSLDKGITRYLDNGEVQNKYVPGTIKANVNENKPYDIILSSKELDFDTVYKLIKNKIKYAEEYGEIIKTESNKIESDSIEKGLIMDSIDAIYSYSDFNKKEIYAGFPYFNEFWLRDALLILPSYLSIGNYQFYRDIITKLINAIDQNGLANTINGSLYPKDVIGLLIIDIYEYYKYTADKSVLDLFHEKIEVVMNLINKWYENGFIHDKGRETWMDSLDREYSVEIQAIWINALECIHKMYKGDSVYRIAKTLRENLNTMFNGSYLRDQRDADINSANQIFAAYFHAVDKEKITAIIKNVENNMLTENGILSVSKNDNSFDFNSYQRGSIWPMLTELFAAVCFENDREDLGRKVLSILNKNDGIQCSSRINEILQPDGTPNGCPSQAWSISIIPFIIERHVLGIVPNAPYSEIEVFKRSNVNGKKLISVNDNNIEISIKNGKIKSNYNYTELSDRFVIEI